MPYLPVRLSSFAKKVTGSINELRIIENAPLQVMTERRLMYINKFGQLSPRMVDCPSVTKTEIEKIYADMIESTRYDQRAGAAQGCILLDNGLRVGVAGYKTNECVVDISALVVRFCREYKGCSNMIFELIEDKKPCSVLIISKPAMGKTTILRDLLQKLSESRVKCCAVDTTTELSGSGIRLGSNTIILRGYEKLQGAVLAVKYLSPDIIAFDEITSTEDMKAVKYCSTMGVPLIATCHAKSVQELLKREDVYECINRKLFDYVAVIGDTIGRIDAITSVEELCTNR